MTSSLEEKSPELPPASPGSADGGGNRGLEKFLSESVYNFNDSSSNANKNTSGSRDVRATSGKGNDTDLNFLVMTDIFAKNGQNGSGLGGGLDGLGLFKEKSPGDRGPQAGAKRPDMPGSPDDVMFAANVKDGRPAEGKQQILIVKPGGDTAAAIKDVPAAKAEKPELKPGREASPDFKKEAQAAFDKLPEGVKKLFKDSGISLSIVPNMTHKDGVPEAYKRDMPRNWPPGSSWDNADGTAVYGSKVVVAEFRHNLQTKEWEKNNRAAGVVRHESGHALDKVLGGKDPRSFYSDSKEFKEAYEKDVARLTPEQKQKLSYYLNPNGGRQETFADVFALTNGGPTNKQQTELLSKAFPNVQDVVKKKVASLR